MWRALLCGLLLASVALAADVSGVWRADVNIAGNSGAPVFTFKQNGDKLTGTYSGALGESPLTGTVSGNKVRWEFDVEAGGEKLKLVYIGTLDSDTTMKGTIQAGAIGEGEFSAKKDK
jgi:hypothetical protein